MKIQLFTLIAVLCAGSSKIQMQDITALTFQQNQLTTGRRSAPVKQLEYIGGNIKGLDSLKPVSVQCINVGFDGQDVQWKCSAQLDETVKLGSTTVVCEGYDNKNDPYVLVGSCGLEYTLVKTSKYKQSSFGFYDDVDWSYENLQRKINNNFGASKSENSTYVYGVYLTWALIAVVILIYLFGNSEARNIGVTSHDDPPPSYDSPGGWNGSNRNTGGSWFNSKKTSSAGKPGFLSGFLSGGALGGIASAIWNRNNNSNSNTSRYRSDGDQSNSRHDSRLSSGRQSTSYGGTRRRDENSVDSEQSTSYGSSRRR